MDNVKIQIKINDKEFVIMENEVLQVDMSELMDKITPLYRLVELLTAMAEKQARLR